MQSTLLEKITSAHVDITLPIPFEKFTFYGFAVLAVLSAIMVIVSKNSVRSVLFLILAFFATGGVWMILEVDFLAFTLLLVYVGAVMVLFLFVVMTLDVELAALREGFIRYLPIGILVAILVIAGLAIALKHAQFGVGNLPSPTPHEVTYNETRELGILLYSNYLYPFEIAGILLLVAIVAAISLTFRGKKPGNKAPEPQWQIQVEKKDRLTVLKMASSNFQSRGPSHSVKETSMRDIHND